MKTFFRLFVCVSALIRSASILPSACCQTGGQLNNHCVVCYREHGAIPKIAALPIDRQTLNEIIIKMPTFPH